MCDPTKIKLNETKPAKMPNWMCSPVAGTAGAPKLSQFDLNKA